VKEKSILIILAAENFNEIEFLSVKETFERAGFKIFIASDAENLCIGSKGLRIKPDVKFYNMKAINFNGAIIIGGKGIENYKQNLIVHNLLKDFQRQGKPIGAICIAPIVLARAKVLENGRAVCFPPYRNELEREGIEFIDRPIVRFKKVLTARDFLDSDEFATAFIYLLNN